MSLVYIFNIYIFRCLKPYQSMPNQDYDILVLQKKIAYDRDEKAYRQLFFHFYTSLHSVCSNLIKNMDDADEIVSDIMIKIWQMDYKLAQVNNLKLYLFKSIRNASFTYLAQYKNRHICLDELVELSSPTCADTHLNTTEIESYISKIISELPAQCKLVFKLIKEEGFSYEHVGDILNISRNTIKTHMRIALKRISEAVAIYFSEKK